MGIHIYNVTPVYEIGDPDTYHLFINKDFIVTFTHKRSEGLAECLAKAAEAVRRRGDVEVHS